jgi:predicted transcriptional regulator
MLFKKPSPLFSPKKERLDDEKAPMTHTYPQERADSRQLAGNSLWLSKKMIDEGCTLGQTLQVMEERCKSCNVTSPMLCMGQCDTWKVKKELREVNKILSESDHGLRLLNALKNNRRLIMLNILMERPLSLDDLQKKLKEHGYQHSQKTINDYLQPLTRAGLVEEDDKRFRLTLYGRRINEAVAKHGFAERLPIHSGGYEEKILRSLLEGPRTREELLEIAPSKSMSRTLKRLQKPNLVLNNSPSDRVFYFRTKRAPTMERLSPTQKRIREAIPQTGISARALSKDAEINLRRVYKYLRNLRGKKLVFRRNMPLCYELTEKGKASAKFLEEIAGIK